MKARHKLVKFKPQPTLGEKIGPVRIVESVAEEWYRKLGINSLFSVLVNGVVWINSKRSLDDAIGYCHQNLIPIESIERLAETVPPVAVT